MKSLTERGAPQIYAGAELNSIGMPIGGLFSGQIYIGGNGQLWNWDIFNDYVFTGWSGTYVRPKPFSPLEQKFSLAIDGVDVPLDATGFSGITFRGEYPVALVNYQDAKQPVQVQLRAFSPFIPMNMDDSCLPLTVMHYTVKNTSDHPVKVAMKGTLENFVLNRKRAALNGTRLNKVTTDGPLTLLEASVAPAADAPKTDDLALEDWSKPDFGSWKAEGVAFGTAPLHKKELTPEQIKAGFENLGADIENCVTSLPAVTAATPNLSGSRTSTPFTVERRPEQHPRRQMVWRSRLALRPIPGALLAALTLLAPLTANASDWKTSVQDTLAKTRHIKPTSYLAYNIVLRQNFDQIDIVADKMDIIGVNYYYSQDASITRFLNRDHGKRGSDYTQLGWEIQPEGLYETLKTVHQRYNKPVVISENGLGTASEQKKIRYMREHINQMRRAMNDGVDVRGYFPWTLVDNYEWTEGWTANFGLSYFNPKTKERIIEPSGTWFSKLIEANPNP